jgi:tetratricopeptide (TPR) repeat protein
MASPEPLKTKEMHTGRTLLAVYDLSAAPVSFDCAFFLALADLHRQRLGLASMHVLFVPAPGDGFWDREALQTDDRRWRVRNLLIPLCWLWPSCRGVTVLPTREDARYWLRKAGRAIFPAGYRLTQPIPDTYLWAGVAAEHACGETPSAWQSTPAAQSLVQQWLSTRALGRRVVVVTLREAAYYSETNSNLEAWAAFARGLDPQRYFPVILRDTIASFGPLPAALEGLAIFPEASANIEIRAALYETCFLALSVGNGPMNLQWLKPHCRFIIFRLLIDDNFRSRPTPLRAMGLDIGGQLSTGSPFHRLVWEDDRLEVIRREFDRMVGEIDRYAADAGDAAPASAGEPPLRLARRLRETHRVIAARRIYRHLLASRQARAAAHHGLGLLELATPHRFRLWRYLHGFYHYVRGRLAGDRRWNSVDEALEIADSRRRWRDIREAERIYRAILARDETQATALHRLGVIALERGATDEAIDLLNRAIASDPFTADAHYALGEAMTATGRRQEAVRYYRAALSQDPSHVLARTRLDAIDANTEQKVTVA